MINKLHILLLVCTVLITFTVAVLLFLYTRMMDRTFVVPFPLLVSDNNSSTYHFVLPTNGIPYGAISGESATTYQFETSGDGWMSDNTRDVKGVYKHQPVVSGTIPVIANMYALQPSYNGSCDDSDCIVLIDIIISLNKWAFVGNAVIEVTLEMKSAAPLLSLRSGDSALKLKCSRA